MDFPNGIEILKKGLPIIGHIKIGQATPKTSGRKGAPEKFDHLELTGTTRDEHTRLIPDLDLNVRQLKEPGTTACGGCKRSEALAKWAKANGHDEAARLIGKVGMPTSCGIMLPSDQLDIIFPRRLAYYAGRTAYCVGNGLAAMRREIKGTRKSKDKKKDIKVYGDAFPHEPCGPDCPDFQDRRCKPHARLLAILLIQQNVGGCFEFRTTSWNTIPNIQWGLKFIAEVTQGRLRWLPFCFSVAPRTVTTMEGMSTTAYVAQVTYPDGPGSLLERVQAQLQLEAPMIQQIRQLQAGIEAPDAWQESPEDVEAITREFAENGEVVEPSTPTVTVERGPEGSRVASGERIEPEPESEEDEISTDSTEIPVSESETELPLTNAPETPSVGESDHIRSPDVDPSRPKIGKEREGLLKAMAQKRAGELGFDEPDAWTTILNSVVNEMGIGDVTDVRVDELNTVLRGLNAYEMPV